VAAAAAAASAVGAVAAAEGVGQRMLMDICVIVAGEGVRCNEWYLQLIERRTI